MKYVPELKTFSSQEWTDVVLNDFDEFLKDHADSERKVSANSMGIIAKYPDKVEIIPLLIENAMEELEHFRLIYDVMLERGIQLRHSMPKDEYAMAMIKKAHSGRVERFLDRLLIASVSEIRGKERFRAVEKALSDEKLKAIYKKIAADESKHGHIFTDMAMTYFDEETVKKRLDYWIDTEDEIFRNLPIRPSLH